MKIILEQNGERHEFDGIYALATHLGYENLCLWTEADERNQIKEYCRDEDLDEEYVLALYEREGLGFTLKRLGAVLSVM